MNCTKKEYLLKWNGGIVRDKPTEEVINQFAEVSNLNIEVAEKYFNHICSKESCDKKLKSKDVLAMNFKYFGRNTNTFFCKKHLMEYLKIDKIEWNNAVNRFKNQGCDLF